MSITTKNPQISKQIEHFELGKTLVKKNLFFEAFDHFKQSINANPNQGIETLLFLYKNTVSPEWQEIKLLIIAKIYLELNLYNEAFDIFEEILEEKPNHEPTYDVLSKLVSNKALTKKVKQCFEMAIANDIFFPTIITVLPTIYLEEKNYTKAIQLYQKLIQSFPDEFSYYKVLSELYYRKRDYEAASDILSQLIDKAPFKSEELIQPTEQILKKIPRHSSVRILFSKILFRAFKPEDGCQQLTTLIKYHPHKRSVAIQILNDQNDAFPNHPDILYLMAELLIEDKSYTESLTHIQTLIDISALHTDRALILMQKIIQLFPEHCLALEIIGNIYFQQENMIQALHFYEQCIDHLEDAYDISFINNLDAIQKHPDGTSHHKAALINAKIKSKSNKDDEALEIVKTLLDTDVEIESELLHISILTKRKSYKEAQSKLTLLSQKHPFLWNIHAAQNNTFNQYIEFKLSEYEDLEPTDESILMEANFLLTKQQIKPAIEKLQKITNESHFYIQSQKMIARAFFESSRYDLANQIYQRLIKLNLDIDTTKSLYYWSALSQLLLSNEEDALQSFESLTTYDQNYLNTSPMAEQLRKQKFLNHNGLMITGLKSGPAYKLIVRKNHFGPQKKQSHQFEVIGFSQSYNDEGCKQLIKQQYKAAKESFELAIQMDPKFHIPHVNIAFLYLMEPNLTNALEHLTLAESITTNCPYLYFTKALYSIQKKENENAIRYTQQAIKLHSKEGIFYLVLGDLFYNQFQLELATSYWKKANKFMDLGHLEQERYRMKHLDKIDLDYWTSPELLSLR